MKRHSNWLLLASLLPTLTSCGFGNITRETSDGALSQSTLTVSRSGEGSVVSTPAGIDCGTDCSHDYEAGTSVVLTAMAATDSTFIGWTGGGCSGTDDCSITLNADATVEAQFEATNSVTVTIAGSGTGSVTSVPAGIDCGSVCTHAFSPGTMITLTASAGTDSRFAGWGGACTGMGTCTLTLTAATDVTAMFASAGCGDGVIDSADGEQCDSGGVDSATCNALTCKASQCGDSYVNNAAGEQCDAGTANTATCNGTSAGSLACKTATCGDNYVNSAAGEQCDASSGANTATCNGSNAGAAKCKAVACGDNYVNSTAGEQCDASSGANTATCNGSTAGAVKCKSAGCGDGFSNGAAGESCDDGNSVTEVCAYGSASCTVCDGTCHSVAGATQYCNDGIRQAAFEACDDGNATCGTCSADCQTTNGSFQATGQLVVLKGADLVSGDNFTLDDGFGHAVTFEYRSSGSAAAGHVLILVSGADASTTVRAKTVSAINNATIDVTAVAGSTNQLVSLTNDHNSSLGNVAIVAAVADSNFAVTGMSGGRGGDCPTAGACAMAEDCASSVCTAKLCQ